MWVCKDTRYIYIYKRYICTKPNNNKNIRRKPKEESMLCTQVRYELLINTLIDYDYI